MLGYAQVYGCLAECEGYPDMMLFLKAIMTCTDLKILRVSVHRIFVRRPQGVRPTLLSSIAVLPCICASRTVYIKVLSMRTSVAETVP